MNINKVSSLSFEGNLPKGKSKFTKFYVPGKNNTTLRCNIENNSDELIGLQYDVLHKGKVLESKSYKNQNGFDLEDFAEMAQQVQQKVKDGIDFVMALTNAEVHGGN